MAKKQTEKDKIIKDQVKIIKMQELQLKRRILDRTTGLMVSALGLVAALAWNDAIKTVFDLFFDKPDQALPMIIYAVTVTIIAVLSIVAINLAYKKKEVN